MAFGEKNVVSYDDMKKEEALKKRRAAMFGSTSDKVEQNTLVVEEKPATGLDVVEEIPIELLDENPDNTPTFGIEQIERLADGIKEHDFLGAIQVFKKSNGRYEIFSGHRRVRAMQYLGRKTIRCFVYPEVDSTEKIELLIQSNMLARELTPMIFARAVALYERGVLQVKDKQAKEKDPKYVPPSHINACAAFFGKSETQIRRYMDLLKLIPELQSLADDPDFPYTGLNRAKQLSEEQQYELYEDITKLKGNNYEVSISKVLLDKMIMSILVKKEKEDVKKAMGQSQPDEVLEDDELVTEKYKAAIESTKLRQELLKNNEKIVSNDFYVQMEEQEPQSEEKEPIAESVNIDEITPDKIFSQILNGGEELYSNIGGGSRNTGKERSKKIDEIYIDDVLIPLSKHITTVVNTQQFTVRDKRRVAEEVENLKAILEKIESHG